MSSVAKSQIASTIGTDCTKQSSSPHGNGLATTANIAYGHVILETKSPLLAVVESYALNDVCSSCLYAKPSLKHCTACKTTRYCSQACQKRDWKSNHKSVCPAFARALPNTLPTEVRGVLQLLLPHYAKRAALSDFPWMKLVSHEDEILREGGKRRDDIILQAQGAVKYGELRTSYCAFKRSQS